MGYCPSMTHIIYAPHKLFHNRFHSPVQEKNERLVYLSCNRTRHRPSVRTARSLTVAREKPVSVHKPHPHLGVCFVYGLLQDLKSGCNTPAWCCPSRSKQCRFQTRSTESCPGRRETFLPRQSPWPIKVRRWYVWR